jgi:hypothetical protein
VAAVRRERASPPRDGSGGLATLPRDVGGAGEVVDVVLTGFVAREELVPRRELMPATCGGSGIEVEIWPARALSFCPEPPDLASGSDC